MPFHRLFPLSVVSLFYSEDLSSTILQGLGCMPSPSLALPDPLLNANSHFLPLLVILMSVS